ncbi:DUF664 domain-containing protein [Occultella glacieicola]|uniref:DUF664 domain-containing protein n=1 Tax=Occultella glacieicola TaxID=2518684 RepID=A0ABY2E784_9MICO|nr:DUF664 domain-containing protein [Occultella glacieicola]TDE92732.1 DUF664 domain-containing protein [Occultella glacieicola]
MSVSTDILADGFARVQGLVHRVLDDADDPVLTSRLDPAANTVAWLIWHLTRVQDDHVADAAGSEQVWSAAGWVDRFELPLPAEDTGYGHTAEQVGLVQAGAQNLRGYHDAVHDRTLGYLAGLTEDDLTAVIDTSWDPPVTLAVRLVSVIGDDLQHAGQAALIKGILARTGTATR